MIDIVRHLSSRACLLAVLTMLCSWQGIEAAEPAPPPLPETIKVYPAKIELRHVREPQSLQLLGSTSDGYTLDLHAQAKFTSANPKVASVDAAGWVQPVSSGQTEITIAIAGKTLRVPVSAQLPASEPNYSFRHEVMAVLTKSGCNMGACHGYSLGKNGFKLSLRGSDPDLDFRAIKHDALARRVDFQSPAASLLVAKPRGAVPHEGGVRFATGSLSEQILLRWVEQGAPGDLDDRREVERVELIPDKLVLRPGQKHRVQLIAHYDDGSTRDVTRLGMFAVNATQFAEVSEEGLVTAVELGETALVARFERKFAATGLIVLRPDTGFEPTPVPANQLVDRPVIEKLNRLKITPSPLADDAMFLRRVYLDLIGVQPTPDELQAFVNDTRGDKRERTIDALFERSEFVDHWSLKWGDLLQNSRNSVSAPGMYLFREFLRGAIAANMPLDEMARKIFTAQGGAVDDPASVYFAISKDTNDTVERATQVFCGVRMLCARCHAHPLENWTQADYYGLASFFSQVSTRPDTRFTGIANSKLVQVNLTAGPAINPRTSRGQPPRYLGGEEPTLPAGVDRRTAYAQWLTSPEQPYFARGLVNRIWSYFFHRGIVEPVDDVRSTNPPINPALLDALTADFIAHRFDMRHLMRQIVTSQTYQRTSLANETNQFDEQNFSHAVPRRIPAEALLDSLVQATGVPENFGGAPAGFRAAQLPDANVTSPFLGLFGKPQRMEACECERDNNSNMLQALHMINGNSILGRVSQANGRLTRLLAKKPANDELVRELYLWTLVRQPTSDELKLAGEFLASYDDKTAEAAQDLFWALLNSKDFLLVH